MPADDTFTDATAFATRLATKGDALHAEKVHLRP
jgi:hypothetical protein